VPDGERPDITKAGGIEVSMAFSRRGEKRSIALNLGFLATDCANNRLYLRKKAHKARKADFG
jgi:hypothetical protein